MKNGSVGDKKVLDVAAAAAAGGGIEKITESSTEHL